MSRATAEAETGMKGITFRAWHGEHYVTLAERSFASVASAWT